MATTKNTTKNTVARAVTVTLKSEAHAREIIPAGMAEATVRAFTDSDNVHRRRADIVRRLMATGLSHKGIVRAVTIVADGNVPAAFSDSNVSRYALAVDAIADPAIVALAKSAATADSATTKADVNALIGTLFTLASKRGGKSNVAAAVASWQDAATFDVAAVRASQVLAQVNAEAKRASLARPSRGVGGEAGDGGKSPAVEPGDTDVVTPDAPTVPTVTTLPSRIDALTAEVSAMRADDLAPVLIDALNRLIDAAADLVSAGALADILSD